MAGRSSGGVAGTNTGGVAGGVGGFAGDDARGGLSGTAGSGVGGAAASSGSGTIDPSGGVAGEGGAGGDGTPDPECTNGECWDGMRCETALDALGCPMWPPASPPDFPPPEQGADCSGSIADGYFTILQAVDQRGVDLQVSSPTGAGRSSRSFGPANSGSYESSVTQGR